MRKSYNLISPKQHQNILNIHNNQKNLVIQNTRIYVFLQRTSYKDIRNLKIWIYQLCLKYQMMNHFINPKKFMIKDFNPNYRI